MSKLTSKLTSKMESQFNVKTSHTDTTNLVTAKILQTIEAFKEDEDF